MTLLTLDALVHTWLLLDLFLAIYALFRLRASPTVVLVGGILFGAILVFALRYLDLFAAMRALAWLVFLYGPLVLAGLAVHGFARRGGRRLSRPVDLGSRGLAALTALAIAGVGIDAFLIEPTALQTTTHRITSDKVDEPLLIAVISDLQSDRIGDYERRAVQAALDAGPDLILLPGDFVQHYDPAINAQLRQDLRTLFREVGLDAPLGVYAVQGNVEYPQWTEIFEDLPVEASPRTRAHTQGPVSVSALSFHDGFNPSVKVPQRPGFHIAFAHAPDFALGPVQADLLVAGHTHGGQVRLPGLGPLITFSRVPSPWAAGRTELDGGRTLIVSRGVGMERAYAPRLRFLCPPELVFIEIRPAG